MDVRKIAGRTDHLTSSGFGSFKLLAAAGVVVGTIVDGLSSFWTQLYVNEIAQHKLALTSGSFFSVLFFLAPHGMRRRHQEKHPVDIVRNQRTQQGVYVRSKTQHCYDQGYMRRELGMPCGLLHHDYCCNTPDT